MITLYKSVTVCYPGNPLHEKVIDIAVENHRIHAIGNLDKLRADRQLDTKGMVLMPGLVDLFCSTGEPGHEYKETLQSVAEAARTGGFTHVVLRPDTNPPVDNASNLAGQQSRAKHHLVNLHFYGALSKDLKGNELAELYDMTQHGSVGFTDAKQGLPSSGLLKLALEYTRDMNTLICTLPLDTALVPNANVHEGPLNLQLGLKCQPSLAEEMIVQRDLQIQAYTGGRLHFSLLSASGSLELLAAAKSHGQKVSAGVSMAHLLFTEANLSAFNTHFKTMPPLREESDRQALIQGICTGVLDVVVSDHSPEDVEAKDREFDYAAFGMTMLETALALYNMHLKDVIPMNQMVRCLSINPRILIGLPLPELKDGEAFDFTVFDPNASWTYGEHTCQSKSQNSPVFGSQLKGRVVLPDA